MRVPFRLPGRHWLMLGVTLCLFLAVAAGVDLKPRVGADFFFSSSNPRFQEDAKIDRMFPSGEELIVSVASPDIRSLRYMERLGVLTDKLQTVEGVTSVESLTHGPKDFSDAEKSPFWRRLLIADNERSSNVMVFAGSGNSQRIIQQIQAITSKFNAPDFRIQIAGAPLVAEMIRRNIQHDFRTFSVTCFLLFGAAMWIIFRSWKLTLGMLTTCTNAVLVTLILQSLFGQKIGVLTANLSTIVFVVALSHLVYMTFNWRTLASGTNNPERLGGKAWRMTLPASFWSMVCATLGFASLLIVPAKPLRELGIGGTIGVITALICAYLMYPPFLDWVQSGHQKNSVAHKPTAFWRRRFVWVSVITVLGCAALAPGLMHLNTDPSLLDYFKKGQEPREGLAYVDRNGGSNPLTIVIRAADGGKLDNKDEYEKMWDLQEALQKQRSVGVVLSLPVLMEEGHRHLLAHLLSWNHLLNILNEPKHGRVASTFVTKDRRFAAFYLRMIEAKRDQPRLNVVRNLRAIVDQHGFRVALVGGVYELQGELAQLVAKSLIKGLFWLMVFFAGIALIVGRSIRTAAAMICSLSLVPVCMLGGIGLLRVPVDIISAPATNVCIGMAIDSMVHLVFAVRRAQRDGRRGWEAWVAGRQEQWRGIVFSDVIIAGGFAIFAFSNFPPTQRFGLVVVSGTVIDILVNLFLLPLLGGGTWKTASTQGKHEDQPAAA